MNNYIPKEVRDLSSSKANVKKNVFEQIESPRKPRIRWHYPIIAAVLSASVLIFLSHQVLDNFSQTSATPVENLQEIAVTPPENLEGITAEETVEVENYLEFTIQSHQIGKELNHSDQESGWKISNDNESVIYCDLLLTVTNLSERELFESDEFIKIKLYHDNRTEYSAHTVFERLDRNQFSGLNDSIVKPEQTRIIHYIASIPKEIETDGKPLRAIISVNEETYEYIIR